MVGLTKILQRLTRYQRAGYDGVGLARAALVISASAVGGTPPFFTPTLVRSSTIGSYLLARGYHPTFYSIALVLCALILCAPLNPS